MANLEGTNASSKYRCKAMTVQYAIGEDGRPEVFRKDRRILQGEDDGCIWNRQRLCRSDSS